MTSTGEHRSLLCLTPFQRGNNCLDRASCASICRTSSVSQRDVPKRTPTVILHMHV
jgi:hypothetical protein